MGTPLPNLSFCVPECFYRISNFILYQGWLVLPYFIVLRVSAALFTLCTGHSTLATPWHSMTLVDKTHFNRELTNKFSCQPIYTSPTFFFSLPFFLLYRSQSFQSYSPVNSWKVATLSLAPKFFVLLCLGEDLRFHLCCIMFMTSLCRSERSQEVSLPRDEVVANAHGLWQCTVCVCLSVCQ